MKNQILALIIALTSSTFAFAQASQTQTISTEAPAVESAPKTEGIRVSLFKPLLSAEAKTRGGNLSTQSASEKINNSLGLSIGYANMPLQQLGYSSYMSYLSLNNEASNASALRLEGNATYSEYVYTRLVNFKGGLNISKFVSGEFLKDQEPSVGGQVSASVNVYKDMAIELGYTIMRQSKNVNGVDVDTKQSGLEIGLNGTF